MLSSTCIAANKICCNIDGVWDSNVTSIGSVAYAHTNLTEIQTGLELLWRNNINPGRVVMGLGFYGRSNTTALSDLYCKSLIKFFHQASP